MPNQADEPRRIYIAHPLCGDDSKKWGDRDRNFERYLDEVEAATLAGYAVVSWAHYELLHRRGMKRDSSFWLRLDKALVRGAVELWLCGPPEVSAGTREEIEEALRIPIPVRYKYAEKEFAPCPFCRRQPKVYYAYGYFNVSCHLEYGNDHDSDSGCAATPQVNGDDVADALEKWNKFLT